MSARTKDYTLRVGDVRQIKIIDQEKPMRVEVVSGTFTYENLVGDQVITDPPTELASGVLTAPGGAWGTELRITCETAGRIIIVHEG